MMKIVMRISRMTMLMIGVMEGEDGVDDDDGQLL